MHLTSPLAIPLFASIIALAWGAVVQRSRSVRRDFRDAVGWVYWSGFLTLALTITLPLPPVMAEIDRVFGTVGLADFVADAASLATCWLWLAYLYRLNAMNPSRPPVKLRLLLVLVIGAVLVDAGRFMAAAGRLGFRLDPHPDSQELYLAIAHLLYRSVMLLHLIYGITLLRRFRAIIRYDNPPLDARLRLMTWVLWFTLIFIVYECLTIGLPLPSFSSRLLRLRALLMLAVVLAPRQWYGKGIASMQRLGHSGGPLYWLRQYIAFRKLYPLWRSLRPVRPQLSLLAEPRRCDAWWPGRNLSYRLYRLETEIHDWRIALRPYRRADIVARVLRFSTLPFYPKEQHAALIEAVSLGIALANWERTPEDSEPAQAVLMDAAEIEWMATGGPSLADDIRALIAVSDALRSRVVREVLSRSHTAWSQKARNALDGRTSAF